MQELYELDVQYNIQDFLITDKSISQRLDNSFNRYSREKLYLHQRDEILELLLYLDKEVIENLEKDDPSVSIHQGNINDTCLALEGLSHFLYLIWNATFNRRVSLLELELQAEVDKYVMISLWLNNQEASNMNTDLHSLLFDKVTYHDSLEEHELERYQTANYYAAKYCHRLRKLYVGGKGESIFMNELRKFYRMSQQMKLQRINNL